MKENFFGTKYEDFEKTLINQGISPFAAKYFYRMMFQHGPEITEKDDKISIKTFEICRELYDFYVPKILRTQKAEDGTVKFLLELEDGNTIEAVLLPFFKKYTICLSSQVGCKMGCTFCFTATAGFTRNLKAHEIVLQYLRLFWWAKEFGNETKLVKPNIVFMGQGEPLNNFDNVKTAMDIFLNSTGIHLGPRQMTLSTCGYIPGLKRAAELPPVNFALSLHSPFNEIRNDLIRANRKYPLEQVLEAFLELPKTHTKFITFEYLLIAGKTTREEDAVELARILKPFKALVNLIPFNPFPGCQFLKPDLEEIERFKNSLVSKKLRVMIRGTKGDEILAACGQLKGKVKE